MINQNALHIVDLLNRGHGQLAGQRGLAYRIDLCHPKYCARTKRRLNVI